MDKGFEFKNVNSEYVENYENLERKYKVYSAGAEKLVEFADIQETDMVVDLGCGTGISSQEVYRRVGNRGRLIGIDLSQKMLEKAGKRLKIKDNIRLIIGDGFHLSNLIKQKADVILSNFTFYYFLSDLELLFKQCYDTLKPNGRYVFNITSYFTPLIFKGEEYNKFGYTFLEETDNILKEMGYKSKGAYLSDLSLLNNCENIKSILEKIGFSSVKYRLSDLPITPAQALDFTYEGFFKYGSVPFSSSTLKAIHFEKRIKIIEDIIKRTKQRFKKESIEETPKVFDVLAVK